MLRNRAYRAVGGWALVLLTITMLCMAMALEGCRSTQPLRTTVRDSVATTTRITYRDTTIYTPADSASTTLGTDWTAMRKLMAELSQGPRVVRGAHQASVVITKVDSTHFRVEARCDSIQLKLDSALQVIDQTTYQLQRIQEQVAVTDREDKFRMPGWAKGIALSTGAIALALLLTGAALMKFKKLL